MGEMRERESGPVRIGVVGLGVFGRLHARTLAGLAEAQLVAVVAQRQASLDVMQQELPQTGGQAQARGFLDLDRAVAESGAEAWVVASSTASHVAIAHRLLSAGLPVLLEKPVAPTRAEAERLRPLIKAESRNLMMGHLLLFSSELQALRAEMGRLGPIVYMDCVRHRPAALVERLPGEEPFELLMVHDLYVALALTGGCEPAHVSAQAHRGETGAMDLAMAQLQWPGGAIASFTASLLTPSGAPDDGFDRMEVAGRGWMARLTPNPRPLTVWGERAYAPMGLEILAGATPAGMLAEQARHFCRVVRGRAAVPVGARFEDAVRVMGWIERLRACLAPGAGAGTGEPSC